MLIKKKLSKLLKNKTFQSRFEADFFSGENFVLVMHDRENLMKLMTQCSHIEILFKFIIQFFYTQTHKRMKKMSMIEKI